MKRRINSINIKNKCVTWIGWVKRSEVKNEIINEVSHFCTFSSPNSIPFTITKKRETAANANDSMYANILNHQGNFNSVFFFFLSFDSCWPSSSTIWSFCKLFSFKICLILDTLVCLLLVLLNNWTSNKVGGNTIKLVMMPIPIFKKINKIKIQY